MGLYKVSYGLAPDAIPGWQLEVFRSGVCPALLRGAFYRTEDLLVLRYDVEDLVPLRSELTAMGVRSSFSLLLARLRRSLEALALAEDWLIPSEHLSFDLKDMFFTRDGQARLLLRPDGRTPFESVTSLCCGISLEYPELSADLVVRRLAETAGAGEPGMRSMLRVLSSWSLELGS